MPLALAELLREQGFQCTAVYPELSGHTVAFTCALGNTYFLFLRDGWVRGLDPYQSEMERWDLSDPGSIPAILGWCCHLRRHWRLVKLLIRKLRPEDRLPPGCLGTAHLLG